MENPIKLDDFGVPLFSETSIYHLQAHYWNLLQIYPLSSNDFERQIPTGDTFALIDFDILQTLQSDQLKSKSTIESKNSRFLPWIES